MSGTNLGRRAVLTGFAALFGSVATSAVAQALPAQCTGGYLDNFVGGCPAPAQTATRAPAAVAAPAPEQYIQPDLAPTNKPIIDNPAVWRRYSAEPQIVPLNGPFRRGELLLDHKNQYLYFVEGDGTATKYLIGVGKPGTSISARPSFVYGKYENAPAADGTRGPAAVLGPRALYLRIGDMQHPGEDEGLAIHGTNRPDLLGQADGKRLVSGGCFRMHNLDILKLYDKVQNGTQVRFFMHGELDPYLGVNTRRQPALRP